MWPKRLRLNSFKFQSRHLWIKESRTTLAFPSFRLIIGILNSNVVSGRGYLNWNTRDTTFTSVSTVWWDWPKPTHKPSIVLLPFILLLHSVKAFLINSLKRQTQKIHIWKRQKCQTNKTQKKMKREILKGNGCLCVMCMYLFWAKCSSFGMGGLVCLVHQQNESKMLFSMRKLNGFTYRQGRIDNLVDEEKAR